ncbi:MAG: RHS repeat-associated core domain-containing protein [Acidobacteriota bacterium]
MHSSLSYRPRFSFAFLVFALVWLLAAAAGAQDVQSHARGLGTVAGSTGGGPDTVNLFNGNLVIDVPIGPATPVGPELAFAVRAVYNANSWDSESLSCDGQSYDNPIADPQSNAGFGWMVHFGVLLRPDPNDFDPRYVYVATDGSRHAFYRELHPGSPSSPRDDVLYTNDSTYLRLRRLAGDSPLCTSSGDRTCHLLEHPDGTLHEFRDDADGNPRLTRIRDRFDNRIDVVYDGHVWEVRDQHGRRQQLVFSDASHQRLERVELAAFGGATATYRFEYEAATLDRQRLIGPSCAPRTLATDLLSRIELPDGSFWAFDYYRSDDDLDVLAGGMASLRLPTGATYGWTYRPIPFRSQDPGGDLPERFSLAIGVDQKTVDPGAGQPTSTWRYGYGTSGAPLPNDDPSVPCHHVTTVTDPLGNDTEHFFSTTFALYRWSYGLPFTRCGPGPAVPSDLFLSTRAWQGSVDDGTVMRSTWVRYGSDGLMSGEHRAQNPRVTTRRTVYHDDANRWRELRFEDFDGLGQFRRVTADGTLGGAARTVEIDWNPLHGSLVIDPDTGDDSGSTFALPNDTAPWRLDRFATRTVAENDTRAVVEQCFDDTGFLTRMRIRAGAEQAAHDLLATFTSETIDGRATGFVATERFHGGDFGSGSSGGALATGPLCTLEIPATPRYQIEHRWRAGTLQRSVAIDPSTGASILTLSDLDIDVATGLPRVVRDSAGVRTDLVYDLLGRLISIRPETDAWVHTHFALPKLDQPNRVPETTLVACQPGQLTCSGDDLLGWRRNHLDGLGRTVAERRRLPTTGGIEEHLRHLTYDSAGNLVASSSWNSPHVVEFLDHDRFGRPAQVTPPVGPAVHFTYHGVRALSREVQVMREDGRIDPIWRTEVTDLHGRLAAVCEGDGQPWNEICGGVETRYDYDLGDRMSRVCSHVIGDGCEAERLFVHDQRGFLLAERHPELGPTGNGWVHYRHDAFGNIVEKAIDGDPTRLLYRFDSAGRPIAVDELIDGVSRPLESFVYAATNQGSDRRAGKLIASYRHNRIPVSLPLKVAGLAFFDAVVSQHYTYAGRGGRVSSRETRFALGGTDYRFATGFAWHPDGELASLDYPTCVHDCGEQPERTITHRRSRGFLTAIDGFANDIDYQAGGLVHRISYANGATWNLDLDPDSGLRRPDRITTDRGLDSGRYAYDGDGQVYEMGDTRFRYDDLGRLVSGEVDTTDGLHSQQAGWDAQSNLTTLIHDGVTTHYPVSSSTNRLTDATYDAAGRVLGHGGRSLRWDAGGALLETRVGGRNRAYLYDADDERVAIIDCAPFGCNGEAPVEIWTLRDLDGRLLREIRHEWGGGWHWQADAVHREGVPLALVVPNIDAVPGVETGETTLFLHPDHLGSPRQITDDMGDVVGALDFLPFGQDAGSSPALDELRLRFTGHERDGLDYLHARYIDPITGRFLSPDPLLGDPRVPRSWNRYLYGLGDPLRYLDRFGMQPKLKFSDTITVYANEINDTGIADRLFAGQQWYYSLGTDAAPPPPTPVRMLPQVVGRAPCRDFGCRVMSEIGGARQATEVLELAVVEISMLFLAAPLELFNLGGTALRVSGQSAGRAAASTSLQLSAHAATEMAERGVTRAMVRRAVERGTRYLDRRTGTVAHVLNGGMASGRSLVVTTNPFTHQVATVTRMRAFNATARYGGQARYIALP